MQVYLEVQQQSSSSQVPYEEQFKEWITLALREEMKIAELCIRVVDENEMTALNHQYRKKNGPTNVLAFPAQIPPELNLNILGDLILCAPIVEKEALEQQKNPLHHWAHLTIHGVLHLLGYDHLNDKDAQIMETLETELMIKQGYPDPYAIEKEISDNDR